MKPVFIRILGNTPKVRILNYMIRVRGLDFSMSDIARNSSVGWATLSRMWKELVELKVVIMTRKVGRAKLYKLNEENPAVIKLVEVYKKLLILETNRYFSRQKIMA